METKPSSQKCGLATTLMELCFGDKDVGGLGMKNGIIDTISEAAGGLTKTEKEPLNKYQEMATLKCKKVIYLKCSPDDSIPDNICSTYLSAAKNTNYETLFSAVVRHAEYRMAIMELSSAISVFKDDPSDFVTKYGRHWFFCMQRM